MANAFLFIALVLFLVAAFGYKQAWSTPLGLLGLASTVIGLGALKILGIS